MIINSNKHLSYCTNIHPGENWIETFHALKSNILLIKNEISNENSFGIGLRLSNLAATELLADKNMEVFINWLNQNNLYVFTANAFPFGSFHQTQVKENVHFPDWQTIERIEYTKKVAIILSQLPNIGSEQSISTSPLSYKFWHHSEQEKQNIFEISAKYLLEMAIFLEKLKIETGRYIHLNLEPEPDGLIENNDEFINFYENILLPYAIKNDEKGEVLIRKYIGICYDICHYAVMFENHEQAIQNLKNKNIKIGKVQISSALKIDFNAISISEIKMQLSKFVESTYLHQVVQLNTDGTFERFSDLDLALKSINNSIKEWRVHFHVPIFANTFSGITSTKSDIIEVLKLNQKYDFCNHFEVETYTWDILPGTEKLPITLSIVNELNWVKDKI